MAVRKSTVYSVVLLVLAVWFGLIIYLSYDDKHLFKPFSQADLKRAQPAEFLLYAVLNARPDSPPPAPGQVNTLLVVLKNRNGSENLPLLLPHDEFSCLRVQVRPIGAKDFTYDQLAGDPQTNVSGGSNEARMILQWHTLNLPAQQAIAREVLLPKNAFPQAGDYEIVLTWNSDDFKRLNDHVAPIDRDSRVVAFSVTQKLTIPPVVPPAPTSPAPTSPAGRPASR